MECACREDDRRLAAFAERIACGIRLKRETTAETHALKAEERASEAVEAA
jgi:hypothetical protein